MLARLPLPTRTAPARADPFDEPQRRTARTRSSTAATPAPTAPPPLLIIAGAGSGKTLTLAARVARLVLDGADPQRILLLSFSRRAAQSLQRRVGRMLHQALGFGATQPPPALPWSGTFHGVGARLLRDYAPRIGLNPAFTIADRGDSEDLLGLLRHELGLSKTHARFPLKGTCLAIYSRVRQQPAAAGAGAAAALSRGAPPGRPS